LISAEFRREDHFFVQLTVQGHSPDSYGKKGENLVCAAVSMLTQTLVLYLLKKNKLEFSELQNGFLKILLKEPDIQTESCMEMVLTGLEKLKTQEPDLIVIQMI